MDCELVCMICKGMQDYKVNLSYYHGLCKIHRFTQDQLIKCEHCSSLVPKLFISAFSRCVNCSRFSKNVYKYCNHNACDTCFTSPCPLCSNLCDFCISFKGKILENCNHLICSNCFDENGMLCPLCKKPDEDSFGICDYCNKSVISKDSQKCKHRICVKCFENSEQCPMCQLFSIKFYETCENCKGDQEPISTKSCEHRICVKCFEVKQQCQLCLGKKGSDLKSKKEIKAENKTAEQLGVGSQGNKNQTMRSSQVEDNQKNVKFKESQGNQRSQWLNKRKAEQKNEEEKTHKKKELANLVQPTPVEKNPRTVEPVSVGKKPPNTEPASIVQPFSEEKNRNKTVPVNSTQSFKKGANTDRTSINEIKVISASKSLPKTPRNVQTIKNNQDNEFINENKEKPKQENKYIEKTPESTKEKINHIYNNEEKKNNTPENMKKITEPVKKAENISKDEPKSISLDIKETVSINPIKIEIISHTEINTINVAKQTPTNEVCNTDTDKKLNTEIKEVQKEEKNVNINEEKKIVTEEKKNSEQSITKEKILESKNIEEEKQPISNKNRNKRKNKKKSKGNKKDISINEKNLMTKNSDTGDYCERNKDADETSYSIKVPTNKNDFNIEKVKFNEPVYDEERTSNFFEKAWKIISIITLVVCCKFAYNRCRNLRFCKKKIN